VRFDLVALARVEIAGDEALHEVGVEAVHPAGSTVSEPDGMINSRREH
jgi:hypothetical protein